MFTTRSVVVTATAALIAAVVLLSFWPPVRSAAYAAMLVPELMGMSVRPLSAGTEEPTREAVTYGDPADRMDVYIPHGAGAGSNLPAVVLALGVHPQPIDSPEVVQIASAISRLGVVVGVPDSTALRNLQITSGEPAHLADAVIEISQRPEVNPERVGLAGFSAGASMALVAAADPRIADDLRFVSSFGGYADAERLLTDVATSTTETGGVVSQWQADSGIRADITTMLTSGGASASDLAAVDRLMATTDRTVAAAAIASFSPALHDRLAAISPLNFAGSIKAPVFLLHGKPDTAIPVAHAELLAQALGDRVAKFTEFGQFGHGQPGQGGIGMNELGDVLALSMFLRDIVAATLE